MNAHAVLQWLTDNLTPSVVLAYIAFFGFRIGPKDRPLVQIHGITGSFWMMAVYFGSIDGRLGRIEEALKKPVEDESIRISIPK